MLNDKKHTIIIVDDEQSILQMFKMRFNEEYDVQAFDSASELLGQVNELSPSLIVLDWIMPEMDGLQLCRRIREIHSLDPVPIAFYSGQEPTVENLQRAFDAGAQAYIPKQLSAAFTNAQIKTLINSFNRLSHYMRQREIMLSILKHELVNLTTGLTTGVEILSLHPAMQQEEFQTHFKSILQSSRDVRGVLGDLSEVLITDKQEKKRVLQPEMVEYIVDDVREYLGSVKREVHFSVSGSTVLKCERHGLGRLLYYAVKFMHSHLPANLPFRVEIAPHETMVLFTISAQGSFKADLEEAAEKALSANYEVFRNDFMCMQFVQNVLYLHNATFSFFESAERSGVQFSVHQ